MSWDWDKRYMDLAKEISTWSKDPSSQIGAVAIGKKGQVLAQGYNGFPRGISDFPERLENRELKYKYVVHAEMNCIYNATYNGVSLDGATMYVYGLPVCNECAKGIIQTGVKRVVMMENIEHVPKEWVDRGKISTQMMNEASVEVDYV